MSAYVHVVPKEDWEVLRKYFNFGGNEGVILIPEHIYNDQSKEVQEVIDKGYADGYDFGGESDANVDFAASNSHMYLRDIRGELFIKDIENELGSENDREESEDE